MKEESNEKEIKSPPLQYQKKTKKTKSEAKKKKKPLPGQDGDQWWVTWP